MDSHKDLQWDGWPDDMGSLIITNGDGTPADAELVKELARRWNAASELEEKDKQLATYQTHLATTGVCSNDDYHGDGPHGPYVGKLCPKCADNIIANGKHLEELELKAWENIGLRDRLREVEEAVKPLLETWEANAEEFSRAASNSEVGRDAIYQAAKLRIERLRALLETTEKPHA